MRTSEWVAVGYFLYLLGTGAVLGAPGRALLRVALLGALTTAVIIALASVPTLAIAPILRDWLPGAYVMIGYWGTGLLYRGPNTRLERRLLAYDEALFARVAPATTRLPRLVREAVEFAYLCCYPLVPAGLAVLYAIGQRARADAFWTLVLVSTFAAYGVLPWAGTRPPRSLDSSDRPSDPRTFGPSDLRTSGPSDLYFFQRVNLVVLARGSIQVNTFPSGHAASAWAVALFMASVPGAPWLVFALFAVAIGAGAIAGRYHYALDVVAGIAVAVAAFAVLP